ncbi:MAG: 3-hydroxyacyl-CoA dehydrogenase [Burkholderiaceae bacterium]|nr:3-hydroxyacyl-CoA dehydrogenase [Burkholderiaceae bacterium]
MDAWQAIGVLGGASMGAGIAQLLAEAGLTARLCAPDAQAAADTARRMIARRVEKGQLTAQQGAAAAASIEPVADIAALAGCGLVIETQLADRAATQRALAELEAVLAPDAAIALNTSAHPVSVLAQSARRPERVAGLHFFEPAPLMRVVEVIAGLRTAPALTARLQALVARLGHTPVPVQDSPGFVANHIGRALLTEGARIVAEQVATPAAVDRVARETLGLRMGPFELLDLIGLDISLPVMEQLHAAFRHEPRLRPPAFLALRSAAGLNGRRSGAGFYLPPPAPATPDPAVPADCWPRVWIDPSDAASYALVHAHLAPRGVRLDTGARPAADSLCLVMPLGSDTSACVVAQGLDAARTVAVDAASGLSPLAVLMAAPGFPAALRQAALAMFGAAGPALWIADSPGFIAQRLLASLVNLACDVAQQGIAVPADIDRVVHLALGYPQGPLAWGDRFGADRVLQVLGAMHADGDPRDRASPWLRRRAELGLSLSTPD